MTDEIALVELKLDDIDDEYCGWYQGDDGHLDYFTGSGRVFDKEMLIRDYDEGVRTNRWHYFLIMTSDGEKIGNVKIGPIDWKNRTSDLVCLIGNRAFLRKGLARMAILMANRIAFERFDIRRLHSGMYASNVASIKAYTRAGWVVEGTFKGYYLANERSEDRVCVACFNPKYFPLEGG